MEVIVDTTAGKNIYIIIGDSYGKFWLPVYGFGRAIARWNRLAIKLTDP